MLTHGRGVEGPRSSYINFHILPVRCRGGHPMAVDQFSLWLRSYNTQRPSLYTRSRQVILFPIVPQKSPSTPASLRANPQTPVKKTANHDLPIAPEISTCVHCFQKKTGYRKRIPFRRCSTSNRRSWNSNSYHCFTSSSTIHSHPRIPEGLTSWSSGRRCC
jgi:hypothetical protein